MREHRVLLDCSPCSVLCSVDLRDTELDLQQIFFRCCAMSATAGAAASDQTTAQAPTTSSSARAPYLLGPLGPQVIKVLVQPSGRLDPNQGISTNNDDDASATGSRKNVPLSPVLVPAHEPDSEGLPTAPPPAITPLPATSTNIASGAAGVGLDGVPQQTRSIRGGGRGRPGSRSGSYGASQPEHYSSSASYPTP